MNYAIMGLDARYYVTQGPAFAMPFLNESLPTWIGSFEGSTVNICTSRADCEAGLRWHEAQRMCEDQEEFVTA